MAWQMILISPSSQSQISHMMRTRRALIHNTEDNDPEDDDGGPNSYPVYLMEQQTLGVGQIPSP